MEINIVNVKCSQSVNPRMKEIYINSFPPEEQRPWSDIMSKIDNDPRFRFSLITMDGEDRGFITWWEFDGFIYIEHFVMDPAVRGNGAGAHALKWFVDQFSVPVILEVEPRGSNEWADRRISFYQRCGFHLLEDFNYRQPPYSDGLPWVDLQLMTTGVDVDPTEITRVLHREVYHFFGGEN